MPPRCATVFATVAIWWRMRRSNILSRGSANGAEEEVYLHGRPHYGALQEPIANVHFLN